jgi:hypothetical protein
MTALGRATSILIHCAVGVAQLESMADADITGFGNFSNFMINRSDSGSAPTITPGTPGSIRITSMGDSQSRSIYSKTPQDITQFTASFTYRSIEGPLGGPIGVSYGATFVMQNGPQGINAVFQPSYNPSIGYGGGCATGCGGGIRPFDKSVAVSIENRSLSLTSSSSSLYTNGNVGGGSSDTSPIDLFSGNPIRVVLTYDGSLLHEKLTDSITLASYETFFPINIPATVGGSTAYVGFTAGTGFSPGDQHISDFQFVTNAVGPGALPGDYNNNLTVDAADYVLWRDLLGQSITIPNDTTPGGINTVDYDVWRSNFGKATSASAAGAFAAAPIPEPSAVILLLLSVVIGRGFLRHRLS